MWLVLNRLLLENRHLFCKIEKHLHHKMSCTVAVATSGADSNNRTLSKQHTNVQLASCYLLNRATAMKCQEKKIKENEIIKIRKIIKTISDQCSMLVK